jgi:uncharacterized protein YndB with AHSA1/START domain
MSVKKDPSGRRSVQAEAEVPGTPEQVWQAIATGPGVSSWCVPCQMEERVGGTIVSTFGPGMDSTDTVSAWDPPHSFSTDGAEIEPGGPTMATVWTVEARSGGTCLVRVVHSWFAETDEWDGQFESTELGWAAFFRDLVLYLVNFNGQPSKTFQLMGFSTESQEATWEKLLKALGLEGKAVGDEVASPAGAPMLSGEIKHLGPDDHPEDLILLNQPAPGIGHFFAMPMGGMVCLSVRVFLFGDGAADTAAREEAVWTSWVAENFPMPESE